MRKVRLIFTSLAASLTDQSQAHHLNFQEFRATSTACKQPHTQHAKHLRHGSSLLELNYMATCRLHCALSCMPAWTLVSGRPWSGRFQRLKCWPHRISSHHNRAGFVTAADQTESAGPVSFDKELSKARVQPASHNSAIS